MNGSFFKPMTPVTAEVQEPIQKKVYIMENSESLILVSPLLPIRNTTRNQLDLLAIDVFDVLRRWGVDSVAPCGSNSSARQSA